MSNIHTKLRGLADFLERHGLEEIAWSMSIKRKTTELSIWGCEVNPEQMRKLKRVFGPLETAGQPPILYLEGKAKDRKLGSIDLLVFQAFKCEREGYEEVRLDPEELREQEENLKTQLSTLRASGGTRRVPKYRCSPVTAEK